jgi:hypothetical protein
VAAKFKVRLVLNSLNTGIVLSNPTRGMDVNVCDCLPYAVLCKKRPCDGPIPHLASSAKCPWVQNFRS